MVDDRVNPWERPYTLPGGGVIAEIDLPEFEKHADWRELVRSAGLPTPFLGTPAAPVYVITANPSGRDNSDTIPRKRADAFEAQRLQELRLEADLPYYSLNPDFADMDGAEWHRKNLYELIFAPELNEGCRASRAVMREFRNTGVPAPAGLESVARGVFWVQLLGYHSPRRRDLPRTLQAVAARGGLPSQQYTKRLVSDAIADAKKTIVIGRAMNRGAKRGELAYWKQCVTGLAEHGYIVGTGTRQPRISPGNLGPEDFDRVVAAISDAADKDDAR